jgi:hypothetical protein
MRQPRRQHDESAEREKVVKREAPDMQILQRCELLGKSRRFGPGPAAFDQRSVVFCEKRRKSPTSGKCRCPDVGHALPAIGHHDEGGHELDRRRPKDAQSRALAARIIPAADIGHADYEGSAREAHTKRCDQISGCHQVTEGSQASNLARTAGNHLLRQQKRAGEDATFELDFEKRLLASVLGMTPENPSRAFKGLQPYGVTVDGSRICSGDQADLEKFEKPNPLIDGFST